MNEAQTRHERTYNLVAGTTSDVEFMHSRVCHFVDASRDCPEFATLLMLRGAVRDKKIQ